MIDFIGNLVLATSKGLKLHTPLESRDLQQYNECQPILSVYRRVTSLHAYQSTTLYYQPISFKEQQYKVKKTYPIFQTPSITFLICLPSSWLPITIPSLIVKAWRRTVTIYVPTGYLFKK